MFSRGSSHRYYLYRSQVDMRKGFDGRDGLVWNAMGKDPASGEVYVFLNRNLLKLLHWEDGGFVVYYKRLEMGTFVSPVPGSDPPDILTYIQLCGYGKIEVILK